MFPQTKLDNAQKYGYTFKIWYKLVHFKVYMCLLNAYINAYRRN